MANQTITITNRLNLLGGGRPTLWGNTGATTMTWNTDSWGSESEDFIQDITKLITNAIASDSATTITGTWNLTISDTLAASSAVYATADHLIPVANTLGSASAVTVELLTDGIWYYVFQGGVTNAVTRTTTTYSDVSGNSSTYSTPSSPSTVWS